jgi:hypothetical protein
VYNRSKSTHASPSGTILPENHHFPRIEGQTYPAARIIEAVESLLSFSEPPPNNPLWDSRPGKVHFQPGSNYTLDDIPLQPFQYCYLADDPAFDDDETGLANEDSFREEMLLSAMTEAVLFAKENLIDRHGRKISSHYFACELRSATRRYLTQLLGRWYEVDSDKRGGSSDEQCPFLSERESIKMKEAPKVSNPTKGTHVGTSGTIAPEVAANFYDREPHLKHLDTTDKLIAVADYVLSGKNPPTETDYFSVWVNEGSFQKSSWEKRDFEFMVLETDCIDPTKMHQKEVQMELLEAGIREVLECVRVLPSYRNVNLAEATLQVYRRELTWLLGKWIDVAGGDQ